MHQGRGGWLAPSGTTRTQEWLEPGVWDCGWGLAAEAEIGQTVRVPICHAEGLGFYLNAMGSYCRISSGAMGFDSYLINLPNNRKFIRHCASFGHFFSSNESDIRN